MAEVLISPGVLARENDQSQITSQPIQAGAAIIGPTVKGQVDIPKLVTSYSEYEAAFGTNFLTGSGADSTNTTYFTSISAYNYFQNGGTSLLVTRVASASFSPATSSVVSTGSAGRFTAAQKDISPFTLATLAEGDIMNSIGSLNGPYGTPDGANNSLVSGSSDNFRWEVTTSDTSSGQFSLIIRQGNDTATSKQVVETYPNLSLDPLAPNYISKIIGDQVQTVAGTAGAYYLQTSGSYRNASRVVRVSEVALRTPNYLDNAGAAKAEFTASVPGICSGSFGSAAGLNTPTYRVANYYQNIDNVDSQGLLGSDYSIGINLLANRDDFRYNLITAPGLVAINSTTGAGWTTIQSNCETRGDAIFVGDLVNYNSSITQVVGEAASVDSSYVASYWPWLQVIDPNTRELCWVPASTMIPGVYAYNDRAGEPWFAPAGINRGGLGAVNQAERKLTNTNRDTLYSGKINPIATFPGQGIVVFGQKTLQTKASALDRVNVRRLLITLKNYISQIADTLVFEQNTAATRNTFLSQVNPYLESVQQRQGLYAFKVVMDNTNNTPDVIDRNELIGAVYLQPTKTAEFIYLDFNILPTGATFPA
jgi:phage tail sheath protein FI